MHRSAAAALTVVATLALPAFSAGTATAGSGSAVTIVSRSGLPPSFSLLIGGSVIIEQVFALPGIGRLIVQAILARDYPLVQGSMLLLGFAFVVINLLLDIVYTLVDPRVRYD